MVSMFNFYGLSNSKEIQIFLLLLFSIIYLMTVMKNFLVMLLISTYLYLPTSILTFCWCVDSCLSSVTTHRLSKRLCPLGTAWFKYSVFLSLEEDEMNLLVTKAYNQFVAICKKHSIKQTKYIIIALISWIICKCLSEFNT